MQPLGRKLAAESMKYTCDPLGIVGTLTRDSKPRNGLRDTVATILPDLGEDECSVANRTCQKTIWVLKMVYKNTW